MAAYVDSTGVTNLTADIKTLADATYPANASIASEYSSSSAYAIGDYCLKAGLLYKCNTAIAVGGEPWTVSHWTQVNVSDEIKQAGGSSLPSGGTTGQVLSKASNADNDVEWANVSGLPDIIVPEECFNNNAVEFTGSETYFSGWLPKTGSALIKAGNNMTVEWDGTTYECVAYSISSNSSPLIGNGGLIWGHDPYYEEYPFGIIYTAGQNLLQFATLDTSSTHSVRIVNHAPLEDDIVIKVHNEQWVTGSVPSILPTGGSKAQILAKASNANDDTEWVDPPDGFGVAGKFYEVITSEDDTGTFTEFSGGVYRSEFSIYDRSFTPTTGEPVCVVWDGVQYLTTVIYASEGQYGGGRCTFGNQSLNIGHENTPVAGEYPFFFDIVGDPTNFIYGDIYTLDTQSTHTIEVTIGTPEDTIKVVKNGEWVEETGKVLPATEEVLCDITSLRFSDYDPMYMGEATGSFTPPQVGDSLKVVWDGTEYSCTAVDFYGQAMIGSASIAEGTAGDYPFLIMIGSDQIQAVTLSSEDTHTFSITKILPNGTIAIIQNSKWTTGTIPSGVPSVTAADNGKVLRVVNGEWSAVSLPSASGVSF